MALAVSLISPVGRLTILGFFGVVIACRNSFTELSPPLKDLLRSFVGFFLAVATGLSVAPASNAFPAPPLSSLRPVIASFSPFSGAPGTSVVIIGANFSGVTEVRINTEKALFTIVSASLVIATVPLTATTGPVSVSTAVGMAVTFTPFTVAPRVTGFTPTKAAPGSTISIEGENFTGATAVQFNGKDAAAFAVTAQNQIHVTVPAGASSGPVRVTTAAGTGTSTNHFVVNRSEPVLAGFAPTHGVAGSVITVEGQNFLGATAVKFNGVNAASFSVTAPTQLTATVPAGATTGPISVTALSGTGFSPTPFLVTTSPVISGFAPPTGPPGTIVIIAGANFTGTLAVRFNGINAAGFSVPAPTQISAVVPFGAVSGPISVITREGAGTSSKPFLVTTVPVISGFSPTNGPAGTMVTIDGVNFSGVTAVRFGTGSAPNVSLVSLTQIRAMVPPDATTGPIRVMTPNGAGTSTSPFVVTAEKPVLTDVLPAVGAPGTTVLIHGLNLLGATAVQFNGLSASFTVTAPTQITCAVPLGATTGLVSVSTPAGTGESSSLFIVAPRISGITPTNGVPETPVVIRGANFTHVMAVRFNGIAAGFTTLSPNEIIALAPANVGSGWISVTTPAGIVASADVFTVQPEWFGPVKVAASFASGNRLSLSWPATAWAFQLQAADRLKLPNWTDVTNRPAVVGERREILLPAGRPTQFFRLVRP